jgi:hypothetical protein
MTGADCGGMEILDTAYSTFFVYISSDLMAKLATVSF